MADTIYACQPQALDAISVADVIAPLHLSTGKMTSIHNLLPTEYGGPIARAGFQYQDDVAALFCIQMLNGSEAVAIWCELLDDITLIWIVSGTEEVEFVQVKSNELNQKYQTPRDSLRKTWNIWLRLRRRKRVPELAAKDRNGRRKL